MRAPWPQTIARRIRWPGVLNSLEDHAAKVAPYLPFVIKLLEGRAKEGIGESKVILTAANEDVETPPEDRDPDGWQEAQFRIRPGRGFDEIPGLRRQKIPIPRLSGKEGAKDAPPSWAKGERPYVGESGKDFAKRLMDKKYGPGNWKKTDPEYRWIQKWGDRSFEDPPDA